MLESGGRAWAATLDALPPLAGQTVIDLGCGAGEQAALLAARGARVIGIDMNEERLCEARAKGIQGAEFRSADLRETEDLGISADGVWGSFTAAYFPGLPTALAVWGRSLRPGGWVALTEIDDLFGHEPLGVRAKSLFEAYAREALAAGRYDFHMGRKIGDHLKRSGFTVSRKMTLEDPELSFSGPACPEVVEMWRARFDRMPLLRDFCGREFEKVCDEFLGCLVHPRHTSIAKVYGWIATR